MKFGLYSSIANPPRASTSIAVSTKSSPSPARRGEWLRLVLFSATPPGPRRLPASPLIVATAVARARSGLPSAPRSFLLPLHHPVRVAEDVITLDLLSRDASSSGSASDISPRLHASPCHGGPRRALRGGRSRSCACAGRRAVSYRGKHYTLDDVQIRPRPVPEAGAAAVDRRQRAGRRAPGWPARRWLRGYASTSLANAAPGGLYKEAARKAGRVPEVSRCAMPGWPRRGPTPTPCTARSHDGLPLLLGARLAEFQNLRADTKFTLENLAPDRLIWRSRDGGGEFQRWQKATGASTFLLRLRHAHSGGPPQRRSWTAIRISASAVLPYCGQLSLASAAAPLGADVESGDVSIGTGP